MSDEKDIVVEGADFAVEPISDEELESVNGGMALAGDCADGSGCCDGFTSAA